LLYDSFIRRFRRTLRQNSDRVRPASKRLIPLGFINVNATTPSPFVGTALQELAAVTTSMLADAMGSAPANDGQSAEPTVADFMHENQLAEVRLGIAGALFAALRAKHVPTAAHCLRVALGCSAWAYALEMDEQSRDELEVAALLHDIGKIGIPDALLLKPGPLTPDEAAIMKRRHLLALDILRSCCSSDRTLEIVRYAPVWYDGGVAQSPLRGAQLPLGSRILAIVESYDSMTTDHVYRRALPRERALGELYGGAGTQFDPDLVKVFGMIHDSPQLQQRVARRWLDELDPRSSNRLWRWNPPTAPPTPTGAACGSLFEQKLLDNMHDAVVFVDSGLRIQRWNRGAERLTGLAAASVTEHVWSPALVKLRDEQGAELRDVECPVNYAIQSGVQSLRRFTLTGRNGRPVQVDLHAVPVVDKDGVNHGATIVLHDASPEASLEKRCQSLHDRATKDPLTQVANRAEFDNALEIFVKEHLERGLPCSLIICDLDHFKKINDTYGHPAGDEALKAFAQLLKNFCHPGDLAARYGGEEFVLLCADCNNNLASDRAEEIRRTISEIPQPMLSGQPITASFGVTEVQYGDTPATMLRRADRALLQAKQRGRNLVVQLGGGIGEVEEPTKRRRWFQRAAVAANAAGSDLILEKWMGTLVPLQVAIEKLRGFVMDHFAEITSIDGESIHLKIEGQKTPLLRRSSDRAVPFLIEIRLTEEGQDTKSVTGVAGRQVRTRIYAAIKPKRSRDRRHNETHERAKLVMASIKSYLMATEEAPPEPKPEERQGSPLLNAILKRRI
jgi:diguanylate cyclase (GGDEF)-like protein/PAS domain S-box-containing protein